MKITQQIEWRTEWMDLNEIGDDHLILVIFNKENLRLIKYDRFLELFYYFYGERLISKKFIRENMTAWSYFEFPKKEEKNKDYKVE